ncbi:MAG: hypothetical protein NTY65_13805 [Planctomycetota bacterium]|nr:hypothetical protein [Planctomycetota bacterium]
MARRTIRARRASPYLLYLVIALSILTVACAVGWTYSYLEKDKALVQVFGEAGVQDASQKGIDPFKKVFEEYGDPEARNLVAILDKRIKQANEYRSEIQRLTDQIVKNDFKGQEGDALRGSVTMVLQSTGELLAQAGAVLKKSYEVGTEQPLDVTPKTTEDAIRSFMKRLDGVVLIVKQDQTAITGLDVQLKGIQEELTAAKAAYTQQVGQLTANLTDEKNRLTTDRDSAVATTKQMEDAKRLVEDRLIAERKAWAIEKEKIDHNAMALQNNVKDLGEVVKVFRAVPTESGVDGHIVNVTEQGSVGYGDLGKKDGVLLGMTFSIFGQSDLGRANSSPKAECRIVRVMQDSCELRLYYPYKGASPVISGDVLLNPVYDRARRLQFALVGKMDINGDGLDESEQLKALIQEFGGKVAPALTVQTDYLVVGEEPSVPSPPAAGDSPMVKQMYGDARNRFIEYTKARAEAESFSIPILNLNRFLGLVGIAGQK